MTLLADVVAHCEQRNVQVALIGAAAMTLYGVSRTTFDTDLLAVDRAVLRSELWADFPDIADVRKGDFDDPLAGVVRIKRGGERTVDVVVAKYRFQAGDLVLLKLFAGGPKDLLDVGMLLQADPSLRAHVEQHLSELPDVVQRAEVR
ncbi:MAG TPA: hypothetical protein VFP80_16900, partial [Thermoanaerobaculia bacterium]|nr:hypothetical protein [Thermoanaerobaculia bacterium]